MYLDFHEVEIVEGDMVKIIEPDKEWFNYLDTNSSLMLHEACGNPVKVNYIDDDGWLSLNLPATIAEDRDYM